MFILARLSQGIGMEPSAPRGMRMFGAMTTLLVLLILTIWASVLGYRAAANPQRRR